MEKIDSVPEGWYEKNRITELSLGPNISLLRREKRNGDLFGLFSYHIKIYNHEFPIKMDAWNLALTKRKSIYYLEYKYIEDDYSTSYVYETSSGVYIIKGDRDEVKKD